MGVPSSSQRIQNKFSPSIGGVKIADFVHLYFEITSRWAMEDIFEQRRPIEFCTKFDKKDHQSEKIHRRSLADASQNAPNLTPLCIHEFLLKHIVAMLPQPPNSFVLAPADFFLLPRIKIPIFSALRLSKPPRNYSFKICWLEVFKGSIVYGRLHEKMYRFLMESTLKIINTLYRYHQSTMEDKRKRSTVWLKENKVPSQSFGFNYGWEWRAQKTS